MNKNKFKTFLNNLKIAFNKNKKKSITILVILILSIISSVTLIAYSFYVNRSQNLIISGIASLDSSDVKIDIYREDRDSNGTGIGTYSLSYYVPGETTYTYNTSKTSCDDGVTINSFSNSVFAVNATKKGKCKVYFDAIDGYIEDYVVNLFVQQTPGNTDNSNYNQMGKLPKIETGYHYIINSSKTSCSPTATVSISGTNIVVETTQKTTCTVYVDKEVYTAVPTISTVSVNGYKINTTITDDLGIQEYGYSTSNTVEPSVYKSIKESKTVTISDVLENGTYYLWAKNLAGNTSVSSAFTVSVTLTFAINDLGVGSNYVYATFTSPTGIGGYGIAYDQYTKPTVQTPNDMYNAKVYKFYESLPYNGTYYLYLYNKSNASVHKQFTLKTSTSPTISSVMWYGSTGTNKKLGFTLKDSQGLAGFQVVSSISKYSSNNWLSISGTSLTVPDGYGDGSRKFGYIGMNYIFVKNELGEITFYAKKVSSSNAEI